MADQKLPEEYNDPSREGRKFGPQDEKYGRIAKKLDVIAKSKNTTITSIALAYVMHKAPVSRCWSYADPRTDAFYLVRLPHCRRKEDRTPERQHRST